MSNFLNYENIINLFQSFIENMTVDRGKKCASFAPETEIIQRIVNYTYKILEKLFLNYLGTLKKTHFWEILNSSFEKHISFQYMNSLQYLANEKEKSFIWIFLELFHVKQMDKLLIYFRNTQEISKDDLYRLIHNIQKIYLLENFVINSSLFKDYDIFTNNNNANSTIDKKYEDLKIQWNSYYNKLVNYKKEKLLTLEKTESNKKNFLTYSDNSTPITKSHSNIDLENSQESENLKSNHNSEKLFQKFKDLFQKFSFEKNPEKMPSVYIHILKF